MKFRILFLAHSQSIHTKRWVQYFIQQNWEVHIITFHREKIAGAVCHYFPAGNIRLSGNNIQYLIHLPKIIHLIHRLQPDIVNSHFLSSFGLLAWLSGYGRHVINVHGTDVLINARKSSFFKWLYGKVLHSAWHIFSVSDAMSEVLQNTFNIPESKISTIQYGVDVNEFKRTASWRDREYDFITNRSFITNSNYDFLLKVIAHLKHYKPDLKLCIIGQGPLKNSIQQLVNQYKLEENTIIKDPVPPAEMPEQLNKGRFYVSVTSSDGTPLSLFEAAASGCFPLLSDNPSNLEWNRRGLRAQIIPLHDVDKAGSAIKNLFNKNLNDSLQDNEKFVKDNMNYDTNMALVVRIMRSFLI